RPRSPPRSETGRGCRSWRAPRSRRTPAPAPSADQADVLRKALFSRAPLGVGQLHAAGEAVRIQLLQLGPLVGLVGDELHHEIGLPLDRLRILPAEAALGLRAERRERIHAEADADLVEAALGHRHLLQLARKSLQRLVRIVERKGEPFERSFDHRLAQAGVLGETLLLRHEGKAIEAYAVLAVGDEARVDALRRER